jgi:predicted MFS family arabinose efflux permease
MSGSSPAEVSSPRRSVEAAPEPHRRWHPFAWTPQRCRFDPDNPPEFTLSLNLIYAFVRIDGHAPPQSPSTDDVFLSQTACFTVASLYWNQPILNKIAETFHVTYEKAATVATLMQAGYASGLLLICPAGDMVRRRPFILALITATTFLWIGLCLARSFHLFQALSFLCGFATVTPQLMLPLVGDFAPPHRRASSLSIIVSGLMLGLLVARLLSGIVANYTDWRNIYWLAFGVQAVVVSVLFWTMPDYPSTNAPGRLGYGEVLASILRLVVSKPLLAQVCLVGFCVSAIFTSFWTTLTFLLSSPPYEYPSLVIGLFALIGIAAIAGGPVYCRLLTDHITPWYSIVGGVAVIMAGTAVSAGIAPFSIAGPIVQAFSLDMGQQMAQVANRTAIFGIDPKARNRINTAYMLASFCGQMTGTAVANRVYALGGWRLSAGSSRE